jgi:hypothetical protein
MSTTNTMEPHIRKTVAEMDADILGLQNDISKLTAARETLVNLYGGDEELPPVQTPRPARGDARPTKAKKEKTGGATGSVAPVTTGRAPTADSIKLMVFVRSAPEPFTAASTAVGTGLDTKFCANRLWRWEQNKIVEKVGRGEFKRAAHFPAEAPAE